MTARGDLDPLKVNTHFDNGAKVKIQTDGPIELAMQRVEIAPGGTTGWHTHPGPTFVVVQQGTLMLYQDEICSAAIPYGPDTVFAQHPDDVHLARNEGTVTVVAFQTTFHSKTTPPTPLRIDAPSPGAGCPQ